MALWHKRSTVTGINPPRHTGVAVSSRLILLVLGLVIAPLLAGCGDLPPAPTPQPTDGGGGGRYDDEPCHPGRFVGESLATSEKEMVECYGRWLIRTPTEVVFCPSAPNSWACPVPALQFVVDRELIVGWSGTH
jgi:hypothetical protein